MANQQNKRTDSAEQKGQRSQVDKQGSPPPNSTNRSQGTAMPTGTSGGSAAGTATAKSLMDQAKETAGSAYEAATDKAVTKIDEQKVNLSSGLSTVADSIKQVGDNLRGVDGQSGFAQTAADYSKTAARKIDDVAHYFENNDVRQMLRDVESYARRNPAVFLGAAFGLGLLAARFLKSSNPRFDEAGAGMQFNTATAGAGENEARNAMNRTSNTPRESIRNPM